MTALPERFPYRSAAAFRSALRDRLASAAREGGHGLDELQRQFAYDRLLARVGTSVGLIFAAFGQLIGRGVAMRAELDAVI